MVFVVPKSAIIIFLKKYIYTSRVYKLDRQNKSHVLGICHSTNLNKFHFVHKIILIIKF
jgi:hypothetical protein